MNDIPPAPVTNPHRPAALTWKSIVGAVVSALLIWELLGPFVETALDEVNDSIYCADPTDTCGEGD